MLPEYDSSNIANKLVSKLRHSGTMYATVIVFDVAGGKGGAGNVALGGFMVF